jgi:hypothetical protein
MIQKQKELGLFYIYIVFFFSIQLVKNNNIKKMIIC